MRLAMFNVGSETERNHFTCHVHFSSLGVAFVLLLIEVKSEVIKHEAN